MNRILTTALAGFASFAAISAAHAASIYDRPPAVLSPDVSDPWLLQLKPGKNKPVVALPVAASRTLFSSQSIGTPNAQSVVLRIPGESDVARNYRLDPEFLPAVVPYPSDERPGTIIIDTEGRHLYLIMGNNQALRYGVGVGRPGFEWGRRAPHHPHGRVAGLGRRRRKC